MPARVLLSAFLAQLAAHPSRTGSLIVTIYGDAVVPRGGSLWLGSLLEICRALGIGDGVVRTAVSRLAAEGWLERTRIGRNSYYRLAEHGRAAFAAATARIYGEPPTEWNGRFTLALIDGGEERQGLRARLEAGGFGRLAPGLFAAVAPPQAAFPENVLRLDAAPADLEDARRLAARTWPLTDLAARYERFLALFETAGDPSADGLTDLEALVLRVLLIHEYRRIILRDPLLPSPLLPENWPGHRARRLCAELYRALLPASERWLDIHALSEAGPLPPPDETFGRRFRVS